MAIEQNGFLNIDGGAVKGNATVSGYEDQIVVQSVSYGVAQAGEWEERRTNHRTRDHVWGSECYEDYG